MPDIFLSYSRIDKDFVRRLFQALEQEGLDSWIDWDDILPSEAWRKAIEAGIEAAHTFLFVISSKSVQSEVCRSEIDWAFKNRKRLIAIVREDADINQLHPEIREINWIFCRESDSFETAIVSLVTAISHDIEDVKSHARLLVRSIEWDTGNRNPSFLLRGSDLTAAEEWLARSSQSERQRPTQLQADYISASRRSSSRRMRLLVGSLSTLLLSSIIAAVVALAQRSLAEARRVQAENNLESACRQIIGMVDGLHAMDKHNINFTDSQGLNVPASIIFGRDFLKHSRDVFEADCAQVGRKYGWSLP